MKNKYYTPSLDEFHIGFGYEWLDEKGNWIKEDSPSEITPAGYEDQLYGLRVKYLDSEDIESLGFMNETTLNFQKPDLFTGETTEDTNEEYYAIVYSFRYKTCEILNCEDNTLFCGIIKNKSELKQVLKMIGVS